MSDNRTPPTEPMAPSALDGSQEVLQSLVGLARVVRRRQGVILWTLAVTLGLGAAYYATATRYYRSDAKLMVIEQRGADVAGVSDQAGADSVMTTHKELVRSPVVLARAIERLAPEHRIDLVESPPHEWVGVLADRLSASTVRRTNFIGVGYESRSPEAASATVRAVIEAYLDFVEETHRGTAGQVLDVLTMERDELARDLTAKQQSLHRSREAVGHLGLSDRSGVVDPIIGRAIRLNDALMQAQQERVELQASLGAVRAASARGEDLRQHLALVQEAVGERLLLASLGLGENDVQVLADQQKHLLELRNELESLAPFYGDAHPRVESLRRQAAATEELLASYHTGASRGPGMLAGPELAELLDTILQQAVAQAMERERRLGDVFAVAREAAAKQSGDFVKLEMLEREVQRLEKLHDLLFEKIAAVDIHQVQAPVRATIVQEPLPSDRPCSPRLRFVLLTSICTGVSLGVAIAYLRDLIDDRFASPEEMASQLGCRVLAVVRELAALPGKGFESVPMVVSPQAAQCEAFRTLRASIVFGSDVSDRVLVSSSEPSDGKTTVSANLAVSYAQSGKRTLLIDSDLRKPGLTSMLGLKGQPGLTDVLTASGSVAEAAEQCALSSPVVNLDVMPAGPRRPDPSELLLRPNFSELLAWADGRYDQVIVDCPPVLAVSDAQIVSRLVDGVVLVVSPEKNHRRLVGRACEAFWSCGANLFGVVANRVADESSHGYGYSYGYGHDEAEDDAQDDLLSRAA